MSDEESSTTAPTPSCPLLEFPPEIRNRIWTLATVETVVIKCCFRRDPSGKSLSPTTMALASTCRQIYHEVAPIYYSKNMFQFAPYETLASPRLFAAAIGPANAKSITAVKIAKYYQTNFLSQDLLRAVLPFPNLKTTSYFYHDIYDDSIRIPFSPSRPAPWHDS